MSPLSRLGLTLTEAVLVITVAIAIYLAMIVFSRIFGQRQFSAFSTYDLAFTFALGSVMGRVILVRTSLAAGLLGLLTLFVMHAVAGWLHHRIPVMHRVMQNRPILLVADGHALEENLRRAATSRAELHAAVRLRGLGSVGDVRAAVLERNGHMSILPAGTNVDPDAFAEVVGAHAIAEGSGGP